MTIATLSTTDLKTRVLAILEHHQGWEHAIKSMAIAAELDMRDDRAVQIAIEYLIEHGHVIAASVKESRKTGQCMGYYIPVTPEQEYDYKHQLRSRALGNFHRYKNFKIACARRREQGEQVRLL
jgi:hypothetical protein